MHEVVERLQDMVVVALGLPLAVDPGQERLDRLGSVGEVRERFGESLEEVPVGGNAGRRESRRRRVEKEIDSVGCSHINVPL